VGSEHRHRNTTINRQPKITARHFVEQEDKMNRKITAKWTGKPWALCSGEWTITVGGEKIDLPEEVRTSDMGTYGEYSRWYFGPNYEENWENYTDGLTFEPWLEKNAWWVSPLGLSSSETRALYEAISEQDWRHGSCGGCI
jgi:hypothetical protein